MLLTEAGAIYSFGEGSYGRLGHNNTDDQREPQIVEALRDVKVSAIAAGIRTNLAVAAGGAAYGWGYGGDATLGLGLTENQLTPLQYPSLQSCACECRCRSGRRVSRQASATLACADLTRPVFLCVEPCKTFCSRLPAKPYVARASLGVGPDRSVWRTRSTCCNQLALPLSYNIRNERQIITFWSCPLFWSPSSLLLDFSRPV